MNRPQQPGNSQPRPPEARTKSAAPPRQEPVIVFVVGGMQFAIPANAVHEIRDTDNLATEAAAVEQPEIPWVRHTVERGGTPLYVLSTGAFLGLPRTRPSLVLLLRDVRCALLVDRIERMDALSAIFALPQAFRAEERRWYLGLALFEDGVVPMLNPQGLLTRENLERLDARIIGAKIDGIPAGVPA
jgi:chemotaxis signal transduction protein